MEQHQIYMQRCIELAKNGLGHVAPNPLVGCVIVYERKIIGEGYHQRFGEAHAEVNAINSVSDKSLLNKSALYVNLEPCAHYGKTPPCADLIVKHQIPEVIIGCIDTFSEVAGKGIKKLEGAGCKVSAGILEKECRELNKRFFTFTEQKRPYIILKWAETADGFIAPQAQVQEKWITNKFSKMLVHKWRSEEPAIMVGTKTALLDNPKLNVREWRGKSPARVVLDRNLSLPADLDLFKACEGHTLVFTEKEQDSKQGIEYIKVTFNEFLIKHVLDELYKRSIQSLIVEGGTVLLNSFISAGLWDEARIFTSIKEFGKGLKAPEIKGSLISSTRIETDNLKLIYNNQ